MANHEYMSLDPESDEGDVISGSTTTIIPGRISRSRKFGFLEPLQIKLCIIIFIAALLGFHTILGLFVSVKRLQASFRPTNAVACHCGQSTAEAISLGCKYDLLASAWLPQHCIDEELSTEFDTAGPNPDGSWKYYADSEGTRRLNRAEIERLADSPETLYYTTHEWHVMHCLYYWRKQFRSRFTRITVEPRYDHEGHIKHCIGLIYQNATLDKINTHQHAALDNGKFR